MTQRILGPSGSTRRRRFLFWPLLLVACTALFVVGGAQAVHDTGAFELEGNATNDPAVLGDDWDNVCHQVTGSDCSTTADTTGATAVSFITEANNNSSIFTGGGSKDPIDISSWAWKDAGGLPDKDNLQHGFAARYSLPPDNDGSDGTLCPSGTASTCDVLYFGSDRFDNSGDAQQGFWFFQNEITLGSTSKGGGFNFNGVHQNGDLLIISDFSNGGTTSTISVYKWNTAVSGNLELLASSTNANCATAGIGDAFCGIVNPTNGTVAPWAFTDKSGLHTYLNGEFYEGGINLSTLGLSGECFASLASETRSSTSTTATLKDFVLGGFGACTSDVASAQTWAPNDSATVTVGGKSVWTGTVTFTLFPSADCSGTSLYTSDLLGVSNASPTASTTSSTSQPAAVSTTGTTSYSWQVFFDSGTNGVPDKTTCIEATTLNIDNDTTSP